MKKSTGGDSPPIEIDRTTPWFRKVRDFPANDWSFIRPLIDFWQATTELGGEGPHMRHLGRVLGAMCFGENAEDARFLAYCRAAVERAERRWERRRFAGSNVVALGGR